MQEYHRLNPEQMAAPQMMLDTHQNFAYMQNSNSLSIEDRQKNLAEEFETLENMRQAQYIQTKAQARRAADAGGPIEEPEQPIRRILQRSPPPVVPVPAPAVPNRVPVAPVEAEVSVPRAPEHPYAKARDAAYAAPKGRNFGVKPPPMPPVKRHEPAYRSTPPVVDNKIVSNVFYRSMEAPITLTQRELLSLAPDVRSQYKDVTTSRRVATEAPPMTTEQQFLNAVDEELPFSTEPIAGLDEPSSRDTDHTLATFTASMPAAFEQTINHELPPDALIAQDKFATLYDAEITPESRKLHVAMDSCAIRAVLPIVDNQQRIECIYDTGSQIVAMSEAVCNELHLPYDPHITINMESANGTVTPSLGLARNVAFKFGDIILYLQVHIVRAPAYDILLGRPFDQLTECKVNNSGSGDQTLTILDRNTGAQLTIPTIPRGRPRQRAQDFRGSMN
jgi:hypothetical protein